ncbi:MULTISPECIES: capsule biosynthesis protein [unclassified Shinella]|uniref:capsule biosynthesis protein n=1 Tax=unclassified Shinella TaxID=2643062 RepID=UPI00225C680F|nr:MULTISPECIES: capsule biosynthesis protein [unclassified Shinella]MCO5153683.1 capsule biosynthesis protein [Shinella sp.]MDC7259940.1 capsule biosynthesis protein [Shinella sp. YE25]CAI0341708.1 Capsular polysaccharide transport system permease protein [Rhizobiaceae bacterium]CAK7262024.1 capsular polysaccharide transport system permease protein [Shinella sp. WSC3-e]
MTKTKIDELSRAGPVIDDMVAEPQGASTPALSSSVETVEYSRVQDRPQSMPKAGGRTPWRLIVFSLIVLVPFLASVIYYAFVAADQYTAEARFAVRSLADEETEDESDVSILKMSPASQDAYVVTSFIHSTEILRRIGNHLDYKAMFVRDGSDFYAEFDPRDSAEEFLNYWNHQVSTYIDGPSSIVVLRVRTFSPEDSIKLANAILDESEKLINELSTRSRNDMIASVLTEVERTGKIYGEALAELNRFQKEAGLLSPEAQAEQTGKLLTGLIAQKLELDSRLFVIQQSNGIDSPTYRQLVLGRKSIEAQIEELRNQMTGKEVESYANTLNTFARLETDRMVAEKLYEATRHHYEMSLAAAMRKALYLTVFVRPMLPEEALYPKRVMTPVLTLFFLFVLWATLSLAWASIEDHRL